MARGSVNYDKLLIIQWTFPLNGTNDYKPALKSELLSGVSL